MISWLSKASRGLAFRIAVLLAATLLPIGIIAIAQTLQMIDQSNRRAETTLLALTAKALGGEEGLIRTGFGAAQAIASFIPDIRDDSEACEPVMTRYLRASDAFSFAGYVNAEGVVTCASSGAGTDLSDSALFLRMKDRPRPYATVDRQGLVSGTSVIVLAVPEMNGAVFDGYVAVSLPHVRLRRSLEDLATDRPVDLISFNSDGEVLTAESGMEGVELRLPKGRSLKDFVGKPQVAFTGETASGEKRVFAVVPIVSNLVYGLGVWKYNRLAFAPGMVNLAMPVLFPVLMWLACLGVAYLAVDRMIIGPTRNLRARMLLFMRSRQISPPKGGRSVPTELREIDETWERLATSVLRDEAELEDTIHDKNVLLKEVHHRVKNNLQLIASILNMTIRKASVPGTKAALTDVQNRVMSLAIVHQNLYETSTEGMVRADEMLNALCHHILDAGLPPDSGVEVSLDFEPTILYPDQAVPLTLVATEAVTNALKYIGKPQDGPPWISAKMNAETSDSWILEIANSTGQRLVSDDYSPSTGLGEQLIRAFVHQLEGEYKIERDDESFRLELWFPKQNTNEYNEPTVSPAGATA